MKKSLRNERRHFSFLAQKSISALFGGRMPTGHFTRQITLVKSPLRYLSGSPGLRPSQSGEKNFPTVNAMASSNLSLNASKSQLTPKSQSYIPRITTVFDGINVHTSSRPYVSVIKERLACLIPQDLFWDFGKSLEATQGCLTRFKRHLPLFAHSEFKEAPFNLSFYMLNKHRRGAFKFFYEMVSRWLVPTESIDVVLFYAADFRMVDLSDDSYTMIEVMLRVETEDELAKIKRNLRIIETEVCLGIGSIYHANRILEIKGLSADVKTAMIQENIAMLIKRRPQDLDYDVFSEMQHFLVLCTNEFKAIREYRHMSRIICVHYIFRRELRKCIEQYPDKRHVFLKLGKTRLHHPPGGVKVVLGIVVAVNFLRDYEVFEERHVLKALQHYIPSVKLVEGSFFANPARFDPIRTLYLEVEKNDGSEFSLEELKIVKRQIPTDLKGRIEHLIHPIFMPRNEEEVMRNIVSLSHQLKYTRDMPQVIISFDEQTDAAISFTIILLRLLKPDSKAIQELFERADTFLEYVPDRVKVVGALRKRYEKEATVCRVRLKKVDFLRSDHSLDLYKARQSVISELMRIVGEVRDYNGGMISKQNELFCAVKESLQGISRHNEWLLENFFYSLTPVVMGTVLEPAPLQILFKMLLEVQEKGFFHAEAYAVASRADNRFVYVLITAAHTSFKQYVEQKVEALQISPIQLASIFVNVHDSPCLGYIYSNDDPALQLQFQSAVERSLASWQQQKTTEIRIG